MCEGIESIDVRRTRPHAMIPARSKRYDIGYDLFSAESFSIEPGEVKLIPIGIAIDVPVGLGAFVCPRSGMAARDWVTVHNAPGVIDPTYTGELKVALHNAGRHRYDGRRFDAIAQLVIHPTLTPKLRLVGELPEYDFMRGIAGFGSTGR